MPTNSKQKNSANGKEPPKVQVESEISVLFLLKKRILKMRAELLHSYKKRAIDLLQEKSVNNPNPCGIVGFFPEAQPYGKEPPAIQAKSGSPQAGIFLQGVSYGKELMRCRFKDDILAILQEAEKAFLAGKPVVAHSCMRLAITELE